VEHYAGLDVSLEQTSVCVVDAHHLGLELAPFAVHADLAMGRTNAHASEIEVACRREFDPGRFNRA